MLKERVADWNSAAHSCANERSSGERNLSMKTNKIITPHLHITIDKRPVSFIIFLFDELEHLMLKCNAIILQVPPVGLDGIYCWSICFEKKWIRWPLWQLFEAYGRRAEVALYKQATGRSGRADLTVARQQDPAGASQLMATERTMAGRRGVLLRPCGNVRWNIPVICSMSSRADCHSNCQQLWRS